jgi:hypothetical protein
MHKFFVETDNLNTISDCLKQLVNAEEAQLSIEEQLAKSNSSSDWSTWRKKAENALRLIKGKRRSSQPVWQSCVMRKRTQPGAAPAAQRFPGSGSARNCNALLFCALRASG